jgi:hypothetical protein
MTNEEANEIRSLHLPPNLPRYVQPTAVALLRLPMPITEMSRQELKKHREALSAAYSIEYERIVSTPSVTNLAHQVDRMTAADYHLAPFLALKADIEVELAGRPKAERTPRP